MLADAVPSPPDDDGPLTDAYRVIRAIAPPETPFEGALARVGEDVVVLVDAAALEGWPGWSFADAQHVLVPIDIARRARGHVVVLPWCAEKVDVFLGRRRAASSPLSGGEIVTIAVSALRGTAEAHRGRAGDEPSPAGDWWLTDAGRPLFVHSPSGAAVEAGARRMLEDVASGCDDRVLSRLLSAASAALERPRALAQESVRLEAELFEARAPQPLSTTVFPAARARDLGSPALRSLDTAPAADITRPLRDTIARHIDGELADAVSMAVRGAFRTLRTQLGRGRRKPWFAAAGVAGAIVLGGALWPVGGGTDPVALAHEPAVTAAGTPTPEQPAPPPGDTAGETADSSQPAPVVSLEAEAAGLLDRLATCGAGGDSACLDEVLERPTLDPSPGAIDLPADERSVTLLDDYGGVAVLRVESMTGATAPQLVVIVRGADAGWLLRDVYDVAEQPSG